MTKTEAMTNKETGERTSRRSFGIRHSGFFGHSSFDIRVSAGRTSGQYVVNDLAVHIGQTPVGAVVAEGQFLVIDAEQVQHRRMKVVGRGGILGGLPGPLVALAVGHAAFDAASSHPTDKRA